MLEQEIPRPQEAETRDRGLFFQEVFVVRMKRDRVLPRSVVVDEGEIVRGVGALRGGVEQGLKTLGDRARAAGLVFVG
jgi:hypothetical protein